MTFQDQILYIVQGPIVWIAFMIFVAGIIGQTFRLSRMIRKNQPLRISDSAKTVKNKKKERWQRWMHHIGQVKTTMIGTSPFLTTVSIIFHICLFITPIFLMGHNVLLKAAIGLSLPSFSEPVSDILTLIVLFCGLFFLLRRLLLRRVRIITTPYDILLLLVVVFPFFTGFLAHHHLLLNYKLMIMLHIISGELILIMIPFSKFFHMIFFFFGRFLIVNEYSLGLPKRNWQFQTRE